MSRWPFVIAGALLGAAACTRFDGFHVVAMGALTIATAMACLPRLLRDDPPPPILSTSLGGGFVVKIDGTPER